jgi:hypothetical protein
MVQQERRFNLTVKIVSESGDVIREKGCNAVMFTNIGGTIARVNGMVVFPSATPATVLGDSRSFGGHKDEEYTGNIRVAFDLPLVNPLLEIVQIFYTDKI